MGTGRKKGPGGGGTSLNFDVKAYATEAELLAATPKENTIGIVTTTAISGWVFSATEPETPEDGMVWIEFGTSSDFAFNALKKNEIQVCPLSAQQYIGGTWTDVIAMSYQGEEWAAWVEPIAWLYNQGEEFSDFTGGLAIVNPRSNYAKGSGTKGANSIRLTCTTQESAIAAMPNNKIDLTDYSTLKVNVLSCKGSCALIISNAMTHDGAGVAKLTIHDSSGTGPSGVFSLDVSKFTGSYYVGVYCWYGYGAWSGSSEFDQLWLERGD